MTAAPTAPSAVQAPPDSPGPGRRSPALSSAWAALAPLAIIVVLFFVLPIVGMAVTSFAVSGAAGEPDTVGLANYAALGSGSRSLALRNSLVLSFASSTIAAVLGGICSWAISHLRSKTLDSITGVLSSVLANSGGVPLAFSFIVLVGNAGYLISAMTSIDGSFTLYSTKGLILMYQYFLIPTMILLTLPSFAALKDQWREANTSLGGTSFVFWRRVGIPIISPALLGAWILMFGSAFGTHASAAVLIGTGAYPLIPLEIANQLASSSATGGEGVAMALGVMTAVIAVIVLVAFNLLMRRSAKWLNA